MSEKVDIMDNIKKFGLGGSIFAKRISVGVDVGSRSIKVVELERKKDKVYLKNFAMVKTQNDLIKAGTAGVIGNEAGEVVKKVLANAKIEEENVNVCVPSFSSLITTIEIPRMPKDEIEKVVQIEAPKYIPVKLDDVVYGWQIIEDSGEGKTEEPDAQTGEASGIAPSKGVKVMIVAIMKEISSQYEEVFAEAGLEIDSLEIDSFSLQRGLVKNSPDCHVVLDVGFKVSNILVICNSNILLNRTIDIAGERITKAIARGMNIDEKRAEQYKIENGIQGSGADGGVVAQMLSVLVSEIVQTIEVFNETYPGRKPKSIILSGGGCYMKGFAEFITRESGIQAVLGNPFFDIELPEDKKASLVQYGPLLCAALGLAKLGFEEKG